MTEGLRVSEEFSRRYTISRLIGRGGMGAVYLAWDVELSRQVAIKFLAEFQESPDSEAGLRFAEEARVCASLKHPSIVRLYSSGWEGRTPYLVFEYIEGLNLSSVLGGGRLPLERVLRIAEDLLRGLQKAHDMGVVHRDVKPGNVIIRSENQPAVLVDFGLAKSMQGSSFRTGANILLGTPAYMAPELVRAGTPHPGVDVYATGCLIYECLAGIRPIEGLTDVDTLKRQLDFPPLALDSVVPGLPPGLGDIVMSALQKDPGARPTSAGEMAGLLRAYRPDASADSSSAVTIKRAPKSRDALPPSSGRRDRPDSRSSSPPSAGNRKPDATIRAPRNDVHDPASGASPDPAARPAPSRPGPASATSRRTGAETIAMRPEKPRRGRRLAAMLIAGAIGSLALLALALRDSVSAVSVAISNDGTATLRWESRRAALGRVYLRDLGPVGSATERPGSLEVEIGEPSRDHRVLLKDLAPANRYQVRILVSNGDAGWEETVTTPPPVTLHLEAGRESGTSRLRVDGAGVTEGTLVMGPDPGAPGLASIPGSLAFDLPHALADLGPGMRVVLDRAPGIQWVFAVESIPELGRSLAADLGHFEPGPTIGKLASRKEFDPWLDFTKQFGSHPIGAFSAGGPQPIKQQSGEFFRLIQQALEKEIFWKRFTCFREHALDFFANPKVTDADKVALYTALHKLQYMDLLSTCQHDMVDLGVRELTSSLVSVEHTLKVDVRETHPGEVDLLPPDTCWMTGDFFDWAGQNGWFRRSRLGSFMHQDVDLSDPEKLRGLFSHERSVDLDAGALPSRDGMATLRAQVILLGPSYFHEVAFATAGKEPALTLLLTQPGNMEWIEKMDVSVVEKESSTGVQGNVPGVDFWIEWAGITLRFPARLLPPGPLRVTTRYHHLPGVRIEKLSNIQRLAFLHRLTLAVEPR